MPTGNEYLFYHTKKISRCYGWCLSHFRFRLQEVIGCILHDFYGRPFREGRSAYFHQGPFSFVTYLHNLLTCNDAYGDALTVIAFHFLTHANITSLDGRLETKLAETRFWHDISMDTMKQAPVNVQVQHEGRVEERTMTVEYSQVGVILVYNGISYLSAGETCQLFSFPSFHP